MLENTKVMSLVWFFAASDHLVYDAVFYLTLLSPTLTYPFILPFS
jgi:hypothetical protein